MSAALHLAETADLDLLLAMVAAFHADQDIPSDPEGRAASVRPLLDGSPLGCVYLIGPRKAPIGYIALSFGWSIEFGGMDGFIDEFYVRPGVRGRGVGTEVLTALLPRLEAAGVRALHLEMAADRPRLQRLYARAGFRLREGYQLMTREARRRPGPA